MLVWVPLGLIDALADQAGAIDTSVDSVGVVAAALGLLALQLTSTLFGEVFYSGAVAGLIGPAHEEHLAPRHVLRELRFGRLVLADIVFSAVVVIGFIFLIVPGVILFTWFGLVAPLIEIEGLGVRAAFARSRALISGRFWRVLAVLGPMTLGSDALINLIGGAGHDLLGHGLFGNWLAETAGNLLVSPFYAVAAVLITMKLIGEKSG